MNIFPFHLKIYEIKWGFIQILSYQPLSKETLNTNFFDFFTALSSLFLLMVQFTFFPSGSWHKEGHWEAEFPDLFFFFLFFSPSACSNGAVLCMHYAQLWEHSPEREPLLWSACRLHNLSIRRVWGSKGSEINSAVKWLGGLHFSERGKQLFLQWGWHGAGNASQRRLKGYGVLVLRKKIIIKNTWPPAHRAYLYSPPYIYSYSSCKKALVLSLSPFGVRAAPYPCSPLGSARPLLKRD